MKKTLCAIIFTAAVIFTAGVCMAGEYGWNYDGENWYYLDEDGYSQTGWLYDDTDWYYLDYDGTVHTGWLYNWGDWYFMDSFGKMCTGWVEYMGSRYFMDESGVMVTGWMEYDDNWYCFWSSGEMATGWIGSDDEWYYLYPEGEMAVGWLNIGDSWYYMDGSGLMYTGWLSYDDSMYYLQDSGEMAVGIVNIDMKNHKFAEDGSWLGRVYIFEDSEDKFTEFSEMSAGELLTVNIDDPDNAVYNGDYSWKMGMNGIILEDGSGYNTFYMTWGNNWNWIQADDFNSSDVEVGDILVLDGDGYSLNGHVNIVTEKKDEAITTVNISLGGMFFMLYHRDYTFEEGYCTDYFSEEYPEAGCASRFLRYVVRNNDPVMRNKYAQAANTSFDEIADDPEDYISLNAPDSDASYCYSLVYYSLFNMEK